jgi:cytoskeletal protein RodZ
MSEHFSPVDKQRCLLHNEKGSTTSILLLLLLFVAATVGYLYYFTDVIKPKQETAKPSVAQSAQVKQPIPPRPGQPGEKEATTAKPGETKPPQGTPAPASASAPAKAQPEQKPAAVPPPAKPAPVKTAQAVAPAKPAPPPAAAPKPAPPAQAVAPKPAPPAQATKKKPAQAKPVQKAQKPVGKKKGGPYHLLIGDFVPDKTFKVVQAKLKKSGIAPVRKSDIKAAEPMNRLYVAEFADQTVAELELQKVRNLTADAFLVPEKDKYYLYAGSYFSSSRAASEQGKLKAKGVSSVIRKVQATIKMTRVTAGSYASPEDARKDIVRLKKQGIKASVVKGAK